MCYHDQRVSVIGLKQLAAYRRWYTLQATLVVESVIVNQHAPTFGAADSRADGGPVKQYCMCSPTRHPGSFRCRQHHAQYVWGGRVVKTGSDND